jgi:cell division protein FtsQ
MTARRSAPSFSAYSAADEVPMDFAPIRAEGRGRVVESVVDGEAAAQKSGGKLRIWLLLLVLAGTGAIFVNQYRGILVDVIAEYAYLMPEIDLPVLTMPEFKRPVINREITTVRMESPLHNVTEAEVRTLLAHYTDSGFLGVDVQDLKAELEQNPWISHASVRRVWPDVLAIRIEEETAVAHWGQGALLSEKGHIFKAQLRTVNDDLPFISGPEGTHALVLAAYHNYQNLLSEAGLALAAVHLDTRGAWTLHTRDGMQIKLGRQQMESRLLRFSAMFARGLGDHLADATSIDLRYTNGFSVSNRTTATESVASR